MPHVFSTITNDTYYCEYGKAPSGNIPPLKHKVLVKGGTGIANKHLVTPYGVATQVSREDLAFLEDNESFQRHKKRGFIVVREDYVDPEVVAANMNTRDGSSPIVPGDFKETDPAKPVDEKPKTVMERLAQKVRG